MYKLNSFPLFFLFFLFSKKKITLAQSVSTRVWHVFHANRLTRRVSAENSASPRSPPPAASYLQWDVIGNGRFSKQECHSQENKLLLGGLEGGDTYSARRKSTSLRDLTSKCATRDTNILHHRRQIRKTTVVNNSNKTIKTCRDTKRWMNKCSLGGGAFSLTSQTQRSARLQTFKYISRSGKLHTGSQLKLKIKFVSLHLFNFNMQNYKPDFVPYVGQTSRTLLKELHHTQLPALRVINMWSWINRGFSIGIKHQTGLFVVWERPAQLD